MRSRAGTAPHRLGITTIQQRSGVVSWLCKCRGCSGPLQSPRRARGTTSARIRSGLNRERANGMTSCAVSKAFDPRSRNAVGEGRSRPRGMRLIRTLTVYPASKRSGVPSTGGRTKDSIAYRHSLQKQPIHLPTFAHRHPHSTREPNVSN